MENRYKELTKFSLITFQTVSICFIAGLILIGIVAYWQQADTAHAIQLQGQTLQRSDLDLKNHGHK